MSFNLFAPPPLTDWQLLCQHNPSLVVCTTAGVRIGSLIDQWDTTSLALIERLAYVEWLALDAAYLTLRTGLSVGGCLAFAALRGGWRDLWLAAIRMPVLPSPSLSLTMTASGATLLDLMERDLRTFATRPAANWIVDAGTLILGLREGSLY